MFKSITVIGNIGKNPEIKSLANDSQVANFSVAWNENWTNSEGEKQQKTTWLNVVAYKQGHKGVVNGLIKPWLRQGQLVMIHADPTIRKWKDQNGNDRYSFEIRLGPQSTIKMLGGKKDSERAANGHDGQESSDRPVADIGSAKSDEEIPV